MKLLLVYALSASCVKTSSYENCTCKGPVPSAFQLRLSQVIRKADYHVAQQMAMECLFPHHSRRRQFTSK